MAVATRTTSDPPTPTPVPTEDPAWPGAAQVADPVLGPPVDEAAEARKAAAKKERADRRRGPGPYERKLPWKTRVALGVGGGLLIVLGIAGLFLPFLQGILFLVLGAAVISLTSLRFYAWLAGTIGNRWPNAWDRVERFRTRVRWKLRR